MTDVSIPDPSAGDVPTEVTTTKRSTGKWSDPEYVRLYYRNKRREQRGVKKHVYILDDGRMWSEVYPYGGFATVEELRNYKKKYLRPTPPRPKTACAVCHQEIFAARLQSHYKTQRHLKAAELLKKHGVEISEK